MVDRSVMWRRDNNPCLKEVEEVEERAGSVAAEENLLALT